MSGHQDRSTYRVRPPSDAKARHLQRRLWAAAKRSPERRFHALYDRIHRDDILWVAWERVRVNRGAAGVDAQTLERVEQYGVPRFLGELQARTAGEEVQTAGGAAEVHREGRRQAAATGHPDGA
jgi:hypothetical protein